MKNTSLSHPELPPLQIPQSYNVAADLLSRQLQAGRGDEIAVHAGDRTWTYRQIAELVDRAGNALLALGLAPEQRVLIVLPDSPELVAAYLGTMKAGGVAVPCNSFLGPAEYAYFLRESRAPIVVTTAELWPKVAPGLVDRPAARILIVGAADEVPGDSRLLSWSRATAAAAAELQAADTHRDEPAFWLWTSGSTGEPKAAVHLHQDWPWCCHLYAQGVLGLTAGDRTFSASKLFHAYGLGNGLLFPFWVGAATVLYPARPTPQALFETIHRTRPTVFFGIPTLYAAMLGSPDGAKADGIYDLSSLRFCVSAGEPLAGELFRQWRARYGTEILDGIGSTEVLHIYISRRLGMGKPGSTGTPVPGYDVRIVDEDGRPLGPGEVGDLVVRGPSTAIAYWNRREQTKAKMRGEWFASGDKYTQDEDGYFWYAGRTDDMFKVGGEWVSPIELEYVLVEHEAVLECAVVPYRDGGVLKPKAVVVLQWGRTGDEVLAEELRAFVRERTAHYKCPRRIEFVTELPKTAAGKIQRFKLRDAAQG